MMLLRNNNRKRRKKKKKKKRKTRTTTTLVSRNALSSRRTRRIKTTETTTSRSEREVREKCVVILKEIRESVNPKLMVFLWVPYLFLVTYISFVTFEKPARLVGVFKTEKRKRASEREKRETFLGERAFLCARFRQHALLSREKRSFNHQSFSGLDTETSQHDEKYTAERVDVWVRHGVRRRVVSNHQSIERWCECRRRGLYFFFFIFERW